jgi:hypothetical protein
MAMNNVRLIIERLRQLAMASSVGGPVLDLKSGRGPGRHGGSSLDDETDVIKVYPQDLLDLADAAEYGLQTDILVKDALHEVMKPPLVTTQETEKAMVAELPPLVHVRTSRFT